MIQQNPNDPSIRISLTVARYLLESARGLVSHLYGADYNPQSGLLNPMRTETPSLWERQDHNDLTFLHWLSTASSILRLIAGILSNEILQNQENLPEIREVQIELEDIEDAFLRHLRSNMMLFRSLISYVAQTNGDHINWLLAAARLLDDGYDEDGNYFDIEDDEF